MRKIKFRAWDKVKNKMIIGFDDITLGYENIGIDLDGDILVLGYGEYWHHDDIEDKLMAVERGEINGILERVGEIEIMQYTGLLDKNGKEIYEGDLIDFENGYISQIQFSCGAFLLDDGLFRNNLSHGVVIGNIYEHEHLLK